MKLKQLAVLVMGSVVASGVMAATQSVVWGDSNNSLQKYALISPTKPKGFFLRNHSMNKQNGDYQLAYQRAYASKNASHERYQIKYKGIPVFGHQIILHKNKQGKSSVTGISVDDIEKDIADVKPKLAKKDIEQQILAQYNPDKDVVRFKKTQKVIFIDGANKAILAYHMAYFTKVKNGNLSIPNFIIDANSGSVLKQWNAARKERIGQGLGGNAIPLPYRPGMFQHGDALPGLKSLGKFDVRVEDGMCHVENDNIKVMNLVNIPAGYDAFPLTIMDEEMNGFKAFSYPCSEANFYLNYADDTSGPVNYAFSPVNDTMYFAQETIDMYNKVYGVAKPFGDDLPIRAYTHLGKMDNAFAIPSIEYEGQLVVHQQIVIGNGDEFLTSPSQGVIGHELSHNFTFNNSNLIYEGQAGGINEAFSDMAAIALLDHLKKQYDWYWDGEDFTIGREATLTGKPLRYMDEPSRDGISISHANNYVDGMDPHLTSGVFNKAFYLLAHKPEWNVQKAFQVMVDANQNYWSPIAYYDFAACGVIQAAVDRQLDPTPVIESFTEVGVYCPQLPGLDLPQKPEPQASSDDK